jgi:small subunit ribosomal protein S4
MRYLESKAKRCRATGHNLYGNAKFDRLKKQYPPGQHGAARKKRSDYALQLMAKQTIRWTYGVNERQLVKLYEEAAKAKAVTGTLLLQLLERRLDNVVYKSGMFAGRDQCRQLVSHGHVLVNGKRMTIASARMQPGDKITFAEKSQKFITAITEGRSQVVPDWLTVDAKTFTITFNVPPEREQIDQTFNEQLLVEYYSR